MIRKSLFLICFLILRLHAFAQHTTDSVSYLKSYLTNTRDIIVAPFHWDKQDVANFTLFAGTTGFLMIYDEKIDACMSRNQNEGLLNFSKYAIEPFGNVVYSLPLLGAVYLSGLIGKNEYDKQIALLGLKTFVITAGEIGATKLLFQRHRPGDDIPPNSWIFEGPAGDNYDGSFVSGHSASAFAIATIFAEGYKHKKKWVPVVAYTLASLVTISRVYEREHWASDALAGACLGYVSGKFIYKFNRVSSKSKIKN